MSARRCCYCDEPLFYEEGNWHHGTPRKRTCADKDHIAIPGPPLVHLPNMWCDGGPSCPGASTSTESNTA